MTLSAAIIARLGQVARNVSVKTKEGSRFPPLTSVTRRKDGGCDGPTWIERGSQSGIWLDT